MANILMNPLGTVSWVRVLLAALLAFLITGLLIDGAKISTVAAVGTPLHITFGLELGFKIILIGVLFALAIAASGGIFASRQALKISIAAGMRET